MHHRSINDETACQCGLREQDCPESGLNRMIRRGYAVAKELEEIKNPSPEQRAYTRKIVTIFLAIITLAVSIGLMFDHLGG